MLPVAVAQSSSDDNEYHVVYNMFSHTIICHVAVPCCSNREQSPVTPFYTALLLCCCCCNGIQYHTNF